MSWEKETILFYGFHSYEVNTSKIPYKDYYDFIDEFYINTSPQESNGEVYYGLPVVIVDEGNTYSIKSILEDEPALKRDLFNLFKEYNASVTDNAEPQFYLAERYS